MDTDRFVHLGSVLAKPPSRRAVHRALAGLAAGSVLAPLIDLASVAAKKKHKKKKLSKKKLCKKAGKGPYCPKVKGPLPCCFDKGEVCTNTPCGCMEKGHTNCCVTDEFQHGYPGGYPCPDDHECCPGKAYDYFPCCPPGETCCGGSACCPPDSPCCGGVCCDPGDCCGGDTCCPPLYLCCPDGQCRRVC
jgi:hypothetical protein